MGICNAVRLELDSIAYLKKFDGQSAEYRPCIVTIGLVDTKLLGTVLLLLFICNISTL